MHEGRHVSVVSSWSAACLDFFTMLLKAVLMAMHSSRCVTRMSG